MEVARAARRWTDYTKAPRLQTDRLVLRPPSPADFVASCRLWGDPAVTRHIRAQPVDATEVWERLLRYAGLWSLLGIGYWAITERRGGEYVGEAGLAQFFRSVSPRFDRAPEIGWVLLPEFQGKGYAAEATRAIIRWSDKVVKPPELICGIREGNAPSVALARKLGFERFTTVRMPAAKLCLYARAGAGGGTGVSEA